MFAFIKKILNAWAIIVLKSRKNGGTLAVDAVVNLLTDYLPAGFKTTIAGLVWPICRASLRVL